jgi:hypothetical protein
MSVITESIKCLATGITTVNEITVIYDWGQTRSERDSLLEQSDIFMLSDRPLTDTQRTELLAYRSALRELPGAYDDADLAMQNMPETPDWME